MRSRRASSIQRSNISVNNREINDGRNRKSSGQDLHQHVHAALSGLLGGTGYGGSLHDGPQSVVRLSGLLRNAFFFFFFFFNLWERHCAVCPVWAMELTIVVD